MSQQTAQEERVDNPLKRVILADDHGVVREGIAAFCASRPDLQIVGRAADGAEAADLIVTLLPDFALVDLNMPKFAGIEVIRRARRINRRRK